MKREWRLDDGSSVEKRRLTPICSPFEKKHKIQIRAYPADARGPLTNHPEGPQWRASLRKYLDDVGYPREAAAGIKGGEGEGRGEGGYAGSCGYAGLVTHSRAAASAFGLAACAVQGAARQYRGGAALRQAGGACRCRC